MMVGSHAQGTIVSARGVRLDRLGVVEDVRPMRNPRPIRERLRAFAAGAVAGVACTGLVACTGDAPPGPGSAPASEVRDSAGIRIVSTRSPTWDSERPWTVSADPVAEFGNSHEAIGALHRVAAITPLPDGGVAVANGGTNEVVVFDADGTVRRRLGREGEGPGEFRWLNGVLTRADSIVAVDGSRLRFSVFAPDGALAREFGLEPLPGRPSGIRAVAVGPSRLAVFREAAFTDKAATGILRLPGEILLLDWEGTHAASLEGDFLGGAIFAVPNGMGTLPFGADLHLAGGDGRLRVGAGERAEILEYGVDGVLERLIRWNVPTRPVGEPLEREWKTFQIASMEEGLSSIPAEARQAALEKQRAFQEQIPFPESLPAHAELRADPRGHLWVRRYRTGLSDDTPTSWQGKQVGPEASPDRAPNRWWVIDPEGRWLGEVVTPPGFRLEVVQDGFVWGVRRDGLGVETVVRHRLVR
jgi:hypothetical protein